MKFTTEQREALRDLAHSPLFKGYLGLFELFVKDLEERLLSCCLDTDADLKLVGILKAKAAGARSAYLALRRVLEDERKKAEETNA